jgi:rfaE bifunctional protein nucleotidyltransferase chain/domain
LGEHLVVAVNSDDSVRRAKGPDRPMFPLDERMELLASLECVDTVFAFDDDTANRILAAVRPDVHAKGTDYGGDTPERDTVLGYGGTIAVVGDPKDHASSELQSRLRRDGLKETTESRED